MDAGMKMSGLSMKLSDAILRASEGVSTEDTMLALGFVVGTFAGTAKENTRVVHLFLDAFSTSLKATSEAVGRPVGVFKEEIPLDGDCNCPACITRRAMGGIQN